MITEVSSPPEEASTTVFPRSGIPAFLPSPTPAKYYHQRTTGRKPSEFPAASLTAEPALDKRDDGVEPAIAGEIFVPGCGHEPAFLRLGCRVEQGTAIAHR